MDLFLKKMIRATKKKKHRTNFGKVNEGEEIKNANEGDEQNKKKHSWGIFLSPEINVFFENRQQSNAGAGQKKKVFW